MNSRPRVKSTPLRANQGGFHFGGIRRNVMESPLQAGDSPDFNGQENPRNEKHTLPYRKPTLVGE